MEDETVENVIDLTMDNDDDTVIMVNKFEDISDDLFADTEGEEDNGNKVAIEKDYDRDLFSYTEYSSTCTRVLRVQSTVRLFRPIHTLVGASTMYWGMTQCKK